MNLRVFYTLHELKTGKQSVSGQYSHTKHERDYVEGTSSQEAYRALLAELGSIKDSKEHAVIFENQHIHISPKKYVTIQGHSMVNPMRHVEKIEGFTAHEVPLLDALTLKACLSDAPKKKLRRTW